MFLRVWALIQAANWSGSYLTAAPIFANGGPPPRTRHCCRVRGEILRIAAASCSVRRRRIGKGAGAPGWAFWVAILAYAPVGYAGRIQPCLSSDWMR